MPDEHARLSYIRNNPLVFKHEKPYVNLTTGSDQQKQSNVDYEQGPRQRIIDVRGCESDYELEKHGFVFRSWRPPLVAWDSKHEIDTLYVPAVKKLVVDVLGKEPERMELFHWRIQRSQLRHARSTAILDVPGTKGEPQMTKHSPARVVHVDQSPTGVVERIHRLFGEEANDLISRYRIQVLNIWKPLVAVVQDMPLAVCDGRLTTPHDLIEVEYHLDDYVRRTLIARHSAAFQFYYLNRMTDHEVCVFKVYDSAAAAPVKCVPHAAFCHAVCRLDQPPRESVEVRILVMTRD